MNKASLYGFALLAGTMTATLLTGCAGSQQSMPPPASLPAPASTATSPLPAPALPMTIAVPQPPQVVELEPHHPLRYTVSSGDTLWSIAARFLKDPWLWPEVWYVNPQIRNPHRIYPGDVIELVYVDGRPRLQLQEDVRRVRLSPQIRTEPLAAPIPLIPYAEIAPFLTQPHVIDEATLARQPYVLRPFEAHQLIVGANDQVYVRGVEPLVGTLYQVVRRGKALYDPESGELLGHEAVHAGVLRIVQPGDPAVARITESRQEIMAGYRLLPMQETALTDITPHAPRQAIRGRVISIYNGIAQAGRNQVVTLNLGRHNGLTEGDVLAICQDSGQVRDPQTQEQIRLPDRRAGEILVFRVFDKVSYALIVRSSRSINVRDLVRNPEI